MIAVLQIHAIELDIGEIEIGRKFFAFAIKLTLHRHRITIEQELLVHIVQIFHVDILHKRLIVRLRNALRRMIFRGALL